MDQPNKSFGHSRAAGAEASPWTLVSQESMSIEAIRRLHLPANHFHVSRNKYEEGVTFSGTRRAGRMYVLSGRCLQYAGLYLQAVQAWNAELGPGSFIDFPAGDFTFRVLGDAPVTLVCVWEIPARYRRES